MSLETLARDHALCADKIRRLKKLGQDESALCERIQPQIGENRLPYLPGDQSCIETTFNEWRASLPENGYDDGESFEEAWTESVTEGLICIHCQNVRSLKRERVKAQVRLGAIRAAITRMGRRIANEEKLSA